VDLDEKIGQLFVVAAHQDVVRFVREAHVGGVIWFATTTSEAKTVNAQLQSIAKTPLLISADLEAGMGMRFTDAIFWPPAMALAAAGDPALAEEQARITAREALAIGVNHILAPVADVNVDPQNPVINARSYGENAHDVARYVRAAIRGTQSEGCLATAKHFPGHGDTRIDSHRALPVLDVTRERLEQVELVPFRAAIEEGVASVMTGHLAVPSLDDAVAPVRAEFENVYGTSRAEIPRGGTLPATVSPRIVSLLRRDLGFEGLILTDSFDMGGLAAHFDPGEAAVRAIEAGNDQVLYSADTDAAIAAMKEAVRSGRLTMARIDASIERIMNAKRNISLDPRPSTLGPARVDAPDIAQRAITLVRDTHGLLPLRVRDIAAVVVTDLPEENPLVDAVRELRPASAVIMDVHSREQEIDAGVIVLLLAIRPKSGLGRISVPPAVRSLAERHARKTIAVSFGSPYILRELGDVSTFICAYGIQPVLQLAAVRALRGEAEMTGRLPVTI
jgi:beta-N-acetylhexosaminidase